MDAPKIEDDLITCWCGTTGTYEELFADDFPPGPCGGLGIIHCECGGDLCVCHNHEEVECPGCDECNPEDDDDVVPTLTPDTRHPTP